MQLLAPGFLLLLPLAFIPLILHLLSRLRLRRVAFPSLLLLQNIRRERFSWFRLKELILLILRTLAPLLLLLALTRPYLYTRLPLIGNRENLIIVLDNSWSMGYSNRWQQALSATRTLLNNTSRPVLILTASPETTFASRRNLTAILDTLKPSSLAPPVTPALNQAFTLSRELAAPVALISDLQRTAFPDTLISPPPAGLAIINLSTDRFVNAGVTRVYLDNHLIRAEVKNFSAFPLVRTVRLRLGERIEEQTLSLPPRTRSTVTFSASTATHSLTGTVEITTDSLPADDIRYFAFTVPESLPIGIVTTAGTTPRYLLLALTADTTAPWRPTVIDISEMSRTDLRQFAVLIVSDVTGLKPSDWERLNFYLTSGGTALFIAGSGSTAPLTANTGLNRYLKPLGWQKPTGFLTVAEVDTTHQILATFRKRDFATTRFFSYLQVDGGVLRHKRSQVPETALPLARLENGDPLIVEIPAQQIIIWTFAPAPEATDIVYSAVFAPLLHRTITYLAALPLRQEFTAGDTVRIRVNTTRPLLLFSPRGEKTISPEPAIPRPLTVITDTRLPGIYRIGEDTTATFAVNLQPEEGNLTPIDIKTLTRPGFRIINQFARPGSELTALLLSLAVAAFILEMLILALERR